MPVEAEVSLLSVRNPAPGDGWSASLPRHFTPGKAPGQVSKGTESLVPVGFDPQNVHS